MSERWRDVVDAAYSEEVEDFYERMVPLVDVSLDPRGPDLLLDLAAEVVRGRRAPRALDVGCRYGRHLVALRRRLGCDVVGVEAAPGNLDRLRRTLAEAGSPGTAVRGVGEVLPFPDGTFDLVWLRDVLVHVADVADALREAARVLRPDGAVVVFHTLATPWLEAAEAERLFAATAVHPPNTDPAAFDAGVAAAGLVVERREVLGSEWREHAEEEAAAAGVPPGPTGRSMLRLARLLRRPEHYRRMLGERTYEVEVGNCLWGVYHMVGKLSDEVLVLRAP